MAFAARPLIAFFSIVLVTILNQGCEVKVSTCTLTDAASNATVVLVGATDGNWTSMIVNCSGNFTVEISRVINSTLNYTFPCGTLKVNDTGYPTQLCQALLSFKLPNQTVANPPPPVMPIDKMNFTCTINGTDRDNATNEFFLYGTKNNTFSAMRYNCPNRGGFVYHAKAAGVVGNYPACATHSNDDNFANKEVDLFCDKTDFQSPFNFTILKNSSNSTTAAAGGKGKAKTLTITLGVDSLSDAAKAAALGSQDLLVLKMAQQHNLGLLNDGAIVESSSFLSELIGSDGININDDDYGNDDSLILSKHIRSRLAAINRVF